MRLPVCRAYHGIRQKTDPAYACIGCAMCTQVQSPNDAIIPLKAMKQQSFRFISTGAVSRGGAGVGGMYPVAPGPDQSIRISMLTDPALDAGRHEFELRTLLGRVLPPEESIAHFRENGWMPPVRKFIPRSSAAHVLWRALSPPMWEGLQMGVAYLERGDEDAGAHAHGQVMPAAPLRSRFLKYVTCRLLPDISWMNYPCHSGNEGGSLRHRDQYGQGPNPRRGAAHVE
ncbi:MAG: hypothetical protein R2875_05360 [Desulfobacterales bacterium]